jgi:hypothetical protein
LGIKTYSQGNNGNYAQVAATAAAKKQTKVISYNKLPKLCRECSNPIEYDKRCNNFCSSSCSAKYTNKKRTEEGWKPSAEQKRKTSESLTGRIYKDLTPEEIIQKKKVYIESVQVLKLCEECNLEFSYIQSRKIRRFCTISCATKFNRKERNAVARLNRAPLLNYRADCAFKFNLKDYPNEFDFALIENFGWYSAKNRGNNLAGVSRDHMVSVKYGFDNNVDPAIIAHPANCRLMQHSSNSSKCGTCSITLDELLHRIKEWDNKYQIMRM